MSNYLVIFYVSLAITSSCFANDSNDSIDYWVNTKYLEDINSGQLVSDCQKNHKFLMLFLADDRNSVIIQSSIFYFGMEDHQVYDIYPNKKETNSYFIKSNYRFDSTNLVLLNDKIILISKGFRIDFIKKRFKKIGSVVDSDIRDQLGLINSNMLLKFNIKPCEKKIFLTREDIIKNIESRTIQIHCSDDLKYNTIIIQKDNKSEIKDFYLFKVGNEIKLYQSPRLRDRNEEFDTTKNECQILYK
ncbi:MAG: hypothetical protein HC831_19465 [Chloroflexia bacterium]|nr:hypothetical protein [Chloroflexia bacterium]